MLKSVDSLRPIFINLMCSSYSKHKSKSKKHSKFFEELGTNLVEHVLIDEGYRIIPTSKNSYPEIKFTDGEKMYAIDMKTARSSCNPQFDLCHIALYPEMNYEVFDEEWVLMVKYDDNKEAGSSLVDCYFEKLHNVAALQKTGDLAEKVLSKGGHAIKCRPMSWERIKNRDFEIKDRETFLKFIRATQDLVNKDVDKSKVMKEQLERFNLEPTKKLDLKTEVGVIDWIVKHNMDLSLIRKSLKNIQKNSDLLEVG